MFLTGKTILIISPQAWGNMFLAKHHYAMELAKLGNQVFFLNPPDQTRVRFRNCIQIRESHMKGLMLIDHGLFFPYWLKFKAIGLFHGFMKFHIRNILRRMGTPIDMVWSFDLGNLYPFPLFPGTAIKIFHPVDEPLNQEAINSGYGAHVIFSVTHEILQKYKFLTIPSHFINHGVSQEFVKSLEENYQPGKPLRIGFAGNLLRQDIDRAILLIIIKNNPNCIFEFFGSYKISQSNIGGAEDEKTQSFIKELQSYPNVVLHGVVPPHQLSQEYARIDAFLICYDVIKDQSKGTNYHKVMEYLATGKVIISNNITTYQSQPDLVQMVESRTSNHELPQLFTNVISRVSDYNKHELRLTRRDYAIKNSYTLQIEKIDQLISNLE